MHLNGFSASVKEAQEETSNGYVVLRHGDTFSVRLTNRHKENGQCKPADACIYIQGKFVGCFRVPFGQTVIIEHPTNDSGKFTAYCNGSQEASQIGLDKDDPDNGLIKVIWKPGSYPIKIPIMKVSWDCPTFTEPWYDNSNHYYDGGYSINWTIDTTTSCCTTRSCSSGNLVGGGVGLSGHSNQNFVETSSLNYDEPETTIYLRIAFRDNEPRPIKTTVYKVSTPIPRPLK